MRRPAAPGVAGSPPAGDALRAATRSGTDATAVTAPMPTAHVSRSRSTAPTVRWWTWPIVITALFLVLQPVIGSGWAMFPDSYRYAKQAEIVLGVSPGQANANAVDAYCRTRAAMRTYDGGWVPNGRTPEQVDAAAGVCAETYRGVGDITTVDPRYQSIFTSRPGYPLLAAPFVGVLGIADGMRLLGFAIACAGGLLTYAALRIAGLRGVAAAAGQAGFLISPLGWWALQALGEGLVTVTILAALVGILATRRGGLRGGLIVLIASWLALAFTRFSSLVLVGAALAVACVIVALTVDRDRARARRHLLIAAAVSAGATAVTTVAIPILGLPGAAVTLQDTFTRHFADPLVPDPWRRLADLNVDFWPRWLVTPSVSTALLACALAGVVALALWRRDLLWFALGLAAAGFAQVAAHPLLGEASRLGMLMWMPAILGLAVAVDVAVRRAHHGMTPSSAGLRDRDAQAAGHHR